MSKKKKMSPKIEISQKTKENTIKNIAAKSTPAYVIGLIYFILMACSLYFAYVKNFEHTDLLSFILFPIYFVIVFLVAKKGRNTIQNSILIPIKLMLIILGSTYFLSFISSSIEYMSNANIESQNIFDIKNYAKETAKFDDIVIYTDIENQKVFLVNEKAKDTKVYEASLIEENSFDKEILSKSHQFFKLSDKLNFSYIVNNNENKVILQFVENNKRYLAAFNATPIIEILKEKDSYTETLFKSNKLEIYQLSDPSLMLIFTEDAVFLTEYDTITNIKDSEYFERIYTFFNNHYENEFVLMENATGELIAEKIDGDIKINLFTIDCASCEYRYGNSDIAEIITEDTSYIFNLDIPSNLLKEGK